MSREPGNSAAATVCVVQPHRELRTSGAKVIPGHDGETFAALPSRLT